MLTTFNSPRFFTTLAVLACTVTAGCMRVEIDDPENGAFIEESTVTVTGNVFSITPDDFPLNVDDMTLEINGTPIPIAPDGSWCSWPSDSPPKKSHSVWSFQR